MTSTLINTDNVTRVREVAIRYRGRSVRASAPLTSPREAVAFARRSSTMMLASTSSPSTSTGDTARSHTRSSRSAPQPRRSCTRAKCFSPLSFLAPSRSFFFTTIPRATRRRAPRTATSRAVSPKLAGSLASPFSTTSSLPARAGSTRSASTRRATLAPDAAAKLASGRSAQGRLPCDLYGESWVGLPCLVSSGGRTNDARTPGPSCGRAAGVQSGILFRAA